MEEAEIPTENLQEEMHHHAQHAPGQRWISWVALSSAVLAALAAVSALLSGHHANEAMLDQLKASDHWSYYQAKGIKSAVHGSRIALIQAMGKEPSPVELEKQKRYEEEQKEISDEAKKEEAESRMHFSLHEVFARAVTFFQIGIAVGAISALTKKRRFFWTSLGAGFLGLVFLLQGLFLMR